MKTRSLIRLSHNRSFSEIQKAQNEPLDRGFRSSSRAPSSTLPTYIQKNRILHKITFEESNPSEFVFSSTSKRLFDFCFSALIIFLFFPLFFIISLLIYFSSPGPILYSQYRLGKNGKVFKFYKFRTMHINAEKDLAKLLETSQDLKEEWKINQKLKKDPRVFSFGKILRKTSLDELPQFWNALKGELSVVGPRPYLVEQFYDLGFYAKDILSIRPGITGLWQISGRSRTTFKERIEKDYQYVKRRSFFLDLIIILKTFPQLLYSKGAY